MVKHVYTFRDKYGRLILELESENPLVLGDTQKEVEDTWQVLVGQEVIRLHAPSNFGTTCEHTINEEKD